MLKSVKQFKDKGRSSQSILLYGYGDGGGGPTYVYTISSKAFSNAMIEKVIISQGSYGAIITENGKYRT